MKLPITTFLFCLQASFFISIVLCSVADAMIHFYTEPGGRKCFYKSLRQDTLLIGRYKMEIRDKDDVYFYPPRDRTSTGVVIDVEEVFNSNARKIHQRGSASGQFVYNALQAGEHRLCLTPRSFLKRSWTGYSANDEPAVMDSKFTEAKIYIDIEVGDGQLFDVKHNHKMQSLTDQVNRLNDKLTEIRNEQQFIRHKEESFRDLSERANEGVVRWSLFQLGALVIIGLYQLFKFKRIVSKVKVE